ncbi:DUF4337 domain-containing protein [Phreatobacter stygius]|uniref:DUF4337 domain-containing protein n=1 Tax=Phreatobacter stygius TaxID=1940610 RepID=A0A4D7B6H4_9HYPH|nr:DUF4337 domain-containing protein [Phreatobacter stygius]QCI65810.1 DUF4337 domain-containing protein [Phreatobacter stygius]
MSGGHAHLDASNKKIALLIAVMALLLALAETAGKSAQTDAINSNVEASNLWAFFQAKTIRMTNVRTAAEDMTITRDVLTDAAAKAAMTRQIEAWQRSAQRWDSEPETQEGRRELSARALAAEKKRDKKYKAYHDFEVASAAFQIGIVLASATVITGAFALAWLAGGLGIVGIGFMALGVLAPGTIHLF